MLKRDNRSGLVGTSGDDTLYGTSGDDTIDGLEGNDVLEGFGGNDTLIGGSGNDYLDGGTGGDGMSGGTGNEIYWVDSFSDSVVEAVGEGFDVVFARSSYALTQGSEVEILAAGTSVAIDLTGNDLANSLYGNDAANVLLGEGGNDVLAGFGGNDYLDGGTGGDGMSGGAGDEIYWVDTFSDSVVEAVGEGFDVVFARASYALTQGAEVEILAAGTGAAIDLTGNERDNAIYGNDAANVLLGAGGTDVLASFGGNDYLDGGSGGNGMWGGAGDDVYWVEGFSDSVVEVAGEGNDTVYARASFALTQGSEVEVLAAGVGTAIDLTGNDLANQIYGNEAANVLLGAGGNDVLAGFGGNDYLDGGTGADVMTGGTGNDILWVDVAGDVVNEAVGEGQDTVYARVSYTLTAGSEIEVLTAGVGTAIDLTGNALANQLYGNEAANVLNGGAGNDVLGGFGGADTYAFTATLGAGNVDTILGFETGTDKIQLSGAAGQPFAALATGTLHSGTLVIGTAALDADDYLIYNSGTGALLYDADANGAGAAVQFATLSTGLSLNFGDFIIAGPANNAPAISSGATASVAENSAASTIVYQTVATDADGDAIVYSLTGVDASLLTIDANGAVRLVTPADFETKFTYSFSVMVSDSATATVKAVTLTITDVADVSTPIINETSNPNDSIAGAQTIDPGTFVVAGNPNLFDDDFPSATISGNISDHSDKDFFSITLQAGQLLVLDVDGTNALDSHLRLFTAAGTEIGDNDDLISADPGSSPPFGHNTDSQIRFRAGTSGTYYFSIEAFDDGDGNPATNNTSGIYQINVSIGPAATPAQIAAEDVEALDSGAHWDAPFNLTYGFPTAASQYPGSFDEVTPASEFHAFTALQQGATRQLIQLIANVTAITFAEDVVTPGDADLRYAMSSDDDVEVAYAYYPTNDGPSSSGGSAWFNTEDFLEPYRGSYDWMGILHETGHALGLKHGHEFPLAISADHDSTEYTVMTYRSFPGSPLTGYKNEQWGFPQTLMMLDIAALQQIYGANFAFNATNSVYSWDPSTGEMSINGAGQGAPGNPNDQALSTENRVFMTVWDGGGTDTYNLSNYSTSTIIDLRPGEWTTTSTIQLANLGEGHRARGNVANALMYQGNTASLIENAVGGSSGDFIFANQAVNQLTGGAGDDRFQFMSVSDSPFGAADTITDFTSSSSDRIFLEAIDANAQTQTNDSFSFIGTSAFSGVAGQLRYEVQSGNAHIFGDVNGDGAADFHLILSNVTTVLTSDLFL